ncbi:hypothetical protein Gpo141_00004436 [Globisporangium polare]
MRHPLPNSYYQFVNHSTSPGDRRLNTTQLKYTTFNLPGFDKPVTVIGAHLLANPQDKVRCFEREGQATVLAGLKNTAVLHGRHTIFLGDFNDFSATIPVKKNNKRISGELSILTGSSMVQVADKAPKSTRFTRWWDKNNGCDFASTEMSSVDHILVSNALRASVSNAIFGTFSTARRAVAATATTGRSSSPSRLPGASN